jgi:two-component system cell cycle response regulator DivK
MTRNRLFLYVEDDPLSQPAMEKIVMAERVMSEDVQDFVARSRALPAKPSGTFHESNFSAQLERNSANAMAHAHALIIDDNAYNAEVLERLLTALGGSFTTLHDPMQLQDITADLEKFDIVFLDLELPRQTGYQVLETLKGDLALPVPVVAYTVHTGEMDQARALGFDGFLGKPLDPKRFPDQLARLLAGEQVWETP